MVADQSAASGKALHDLNPGLPKVTSPSPSPTSYVDVGFAADTTQTYKLWVRLKADGNHWSNDSIWVQLTNTVDSSGRSIAPGSPAGIEVNSKSAPAVACPVGDGATRPGANAT